MQNPFHTPKRHITVCPVPCRRRLSLLRCVVMPQEMSVLQASFHLPVQGRSFLVPSKRCFISTRHSTNLKRTLPRLTHLTLQCSGTSWHALSISSSKDQNCLYVVAERATRKLTIFVTVDITSLRAEFEIFAKRFS